MDVDSLLQAHTDHSFQQHSICGDIRGGLYACAWQNRHQVPLSSIFRLVSMRQK